MDLYKLHQKKWIDKDKPLWWDLDYSPDPREFVDIDEFIKRLYDLGEQTYLLFNTSFEQPTKLYVADKVPITLIDVELKGKESGLPGSYSYGRAKLFATARPYNRREVGEMRFPIGKLIENVEDSGGLQLQYHFFPHIRGLFKSRIKNHFFWYPIISHDFAELIKKSLGDLSDVFSVWTYKFYYYDKIGAGSKSRESLPHPSAFQELKTKRLISGKKWVDHPTSDLEEVACDEFVERLDLESHMISVYPIRHPDLDETIPVILSTRTHPESKRRGPTVLGIMGNGSHRDNYRVWRINDKEFCIDISGILSDELGHSFDVVYFDQGRYRLVNAHQS